MEIIQRNKNNPSPHHGQDAAILLSRAYEFATFAGRWPGVAFHFLALKCQTWRVVPRARRTSVIWDSSLDSSDRVRLRIIAQAGPGEKHR